MTSIVPASRSDHSSCVSASAPGPRTRPVPSERIAPLVELLTELRGRARAAGDFAGADSIRDVLTAAGVELRDGAEGTTWEDRQQG